MIIIIIIDDKNDNDDANNKCPSIYSEFRGQAEGGREGQGVRGRTSATSANYGD